MESIRACSTIPRRFGKKKPTNQKTQPKPNQNINAQLTFHEKQSTPLINPPPNFPAPRSARALGRSRCWQSFAPASPARSTAGQTDSGTGPARPGRSRLTPRPPAATCSGGTGRGGPARPAATGSSGSGLPRGAGQTPSPQRAAGRPPLTARQSPRRRRPPSPPEEGPRGEATVPASPPLQPRYARRCLPAARRPGEEPPGEATAAAGRAAPATDAAPHRVPAPSVSRRRPFLPRRCRLGTGAALQRSALQRSARSSPKKRPQTAPIPAKPFPDGFSLGARSCGHANQVLGWPSRSSWRLGKTWYPQGPPLGPQSACL